MENWCWEREALNLFARHYQTGEAIRMICFKKCCEPVRSRRQRANAPAQLRIVDLKMHREYSPERDWRCDRVLAKESCKQFSAVKFPEDHAMIASFTHLFASPVAYGAGYYSYKWAEVLDRGRIPRAFASTASSAGKSGAEFRDNILAKGDSEDPAELYRRFMGRDPDPEALLVRSGLRKLFGSGIN